MSAQLTVVLAMVILAVWFALEFDRINDAREDRAPFTVIFLLAALASVCVFILVRAFVIVVRGVWLAP